MRAMAALLSLAVVGCGGERTEVNAPAEESNPQILVTYRCEVGHTHHEAVEAWPNSQGVLMPATEAGNQIECLTEAEAVEIR